MGNRDDFFNSFYFVFALLAGGLEKKKMKGLPVAMRLARQRLRLEGSNCPVCKELHFPPRLVCPDCGGGGAFPKKENLNPPAGGKERGG